MIQFQKAVKIYILLSIKTRIETDAKSTLGINFADLYPTIH